MLYRIFHKLGSTIRHYNTTICRSRSRPSMHLHCRRTCRPVLCNFRSPMEDLPLAIRDTRCPWVLSSFLMLQIRLPISPIICRSHRRLKPLRRFGAQVHCAWSNRLICRRNRSEIKCEMHCRRRWSAISQLVLSTIQSV